MTDRKTMLITGASTGIGAATARMAAARGYDLILTYRSSAAQTEAVVADCTAAGARCVAIQADVSQPGDIARIFAAVDDSFGRLDVVVNNAGVVGKTARVTDMTFDRMREIFDINVIGAMLVAKEAVLRMEPQGSGTIINISSAAARLGSANTYVDYAASKAAVDIFTKGLSDEVAASGIRVVSVRPGIIDTPIHGKGGEPDRADRLAGNVPMKRKGTADEVAEAILWLASDQASYVTGTALDVTGGR